MLYLSSVHIVFLVTVISLNHNVHVVVYIIVMLLCFQIIQIFDRTYLYFFKFIITGRGNLHFAYYVNFLS